MDHLENAIKRLREAERNWNEALPKGKSCAMCFLSEHRGSGPFCFEHEATGEELENARWAVVVEAKELFPE